MYRYYATKIKLLETENEALKAEVKRLSDRDCNATVELCYKTKEYPFNREDLEIVDVGVVDNVYIVESELLNSTLAERDRLREALGLTPCTCIIAAGIIDGAICSRCEALNHEERT